MESLGRFLEMQVFKLAPKMTYLFFKVLLCNMVLVLNVAREQGMGTASLLIPGAAIVALGGGIFP